MRVMPLFLGLIAASPLAFADPPVLQPSQVIEAPADPGPVTAPMSFGGYIDVDGQRLLVSAINNNTRQSIGYVYRRGPQGDWDHRATLVIPDEGFRFARGYIRGNTVAILGNYASVDLLASRVYIYRRTNGEWPLVQTITDVPSEISMGFDGKTLVLGSYRANAAYVFTRDSTGTYVPTQTLTEAPAPPPYLAGYGVSVAVDGRTLVVGAPGTQSAHVYRRTSGVWQRTQELTASDSQLSGGFGSDVAVSGRFVLVAAPSADSSDDVPTFQGAAYIFRQHQNQQWVEEKKLANPTNGSFARGMTLEGRRLAIRASYIRVNDDDPYGAPTTYSRVFVYERDHGDWPQTSVLEGFAPALNFGVNQFALEGRRAYAGYTGVVTPDPVFDGQAYEYVTPK